MIVGLSGYAQVGKDSIGQILVEDYDFKRYAFADALRSVVYALNPLLDDGVRVQEVIDKSGWEWAKVNVPEVRRLLQSMGTEAGRKVLGENVWVEAVFNQIHHNSLNVVITDVRFPNEAQRIKAEGGFVVRVTRPGVSAVNAHPSETSLDEWGFDLSIPNNGTKEDLRLLAKDGLQKLQTMHDTLSFPSVRLPGYGSPVAKVVR